MEVENMLKNTQEHQNTVGGKTRANPVKS
jgi:hypothetical protein